jgi:hypothetical protein
MYTTQDAHVKELRKLFRLLQFNSSTRYLSKPVILVAWTGIAAIGIFAAVPFPIIMGATLVVILLLFVSRQIVAKKSTKRDFKRLQISALSDLNPNDHNEEALPPASPPLVPNARPISTPDSEQEEKKGWRLHNTTFEDLESLFKSTKVFVIGPFKVGKSSVIGWLSDEPQNLGDQVENTRGLVFFDTKVMGTPAVIVDTEGFHQPMAGDSPAAKEDFIIDFMGRTCDFLVLMVDRLSTQDVPVINRILRWHQCKANTFATLVIVHNVQSITTPKNLKAYMRQLGDIFDASPGQDEWVLEQMTGQDIGLNKQPIIRHYFLGNALEMPDNAVEVVSSLRRSIAAGNKARTKLKQCLTQSLKTVVAKYYIRKQIGHEGGMGEGPDPQASNTIRLEDDGTVTYPGLAEMKARGGLVGSTLASRRVARFDRFFFHCYLF